MLLIHGLKDRTVEPGNASRLADRIRRAGGEVQVITYPDRAHVGVVLSLAASFLLVLTLGTGAGCVAGHPITTG